MSNPSAKPGASCEDLTGFSRPSPAAADQATTLRRLMAMVQPSAASRKADRAEAAVFAQLSPGSGADQAGRLRLTLAQTRSHEVRS
jgi:hypothetical protein